MKVLSDDDVMAPYDVIHFESGSSLTTITIFAGRTVGEVKAMFAEIVGGLRVKEIVRHDDKAEK